MRTSAALAMSEDDEDASARSDEGSRTGGDNTHGGEAGFEKGEDGEEPVGLADAMMFRGERLRAFRLMAEEAEAEAGPRRKIPAMYPTEEPRTKTGTSSTSSRTGGRSSGTDHTFPTSGTTTT